MDIMSFVRFHDKKWRSNAVNEEGETPVMVAVKLRKTKLVKRLNFRGADLSTQNCEGNTVLHLVVKTFHVKTIAILQISVKISMKKRKIILDLLLWNC